MANAQYVTRAIGTKRAVSAQLCCCIALTAAIALAGCKATEAPSAGFVEKSDMQKNPTLPFQKYWVKPGFSKAQYSKLYVAPVNTSYMLEMTDWQKGERRDEVEKDLAKVADYTRTTVTKAFADDPVHRMQIVESPTTDPDALVLEVALIELVPSKVALNALGYAPFGIGTGLTVVRSAAKDTSTVAFEARVRIAATNEIVTTIADRQAAQISPVSVRGLTWYSDAELIISEWSKQFVQLANQKSGETVKGMDTVNLSPW